MDSVRDGVPGPTLGQSSRARTGGVAGVFGSRTVFADGATAKRRGGVEGRDRVLHQSTTTKVFEKLQASLGSARQGGRELDIIVSFVLGDTSTDAGKMIQLLVEEGYPWDVISELLDEDLAPYMTSLDAAMPGENIVLSAYSRKRQQWAAVHRAKDGEQITAWAASECLARRLAGLQAILRERRQKAAPLAPNGTPQPAPRAKTPHDEPEEPAEPAESEWRILF